MANISTTKVLSMQTPTTAPTAPSDSTSTPTTTLSLPFSSPSSTMATPSPSSRPGLSTGAKAGIAAACAILLVVLFSIGICLHISYRRRRDPAYRREKKTPLNKYNNAYPIYPDYPNSNSEGGAPLLRDGSYMDMTTQGKISQHGSLMMGNDGYLSPGNFERNASYASSAASSLLGVDPDVRMEKERWRESHSIAGYFDSKTQLVAEPRLSTGDKLIAEWRREEIERAREKSRERSIEDAKRPHPMAAYQSALPPFFPRGFKDVIGDDRALADMGAGDRLLQPEVHEMDVGDQHRGR